jgi:hypothetical protein
MEKTTDRRFDWVAALAFGAGAAVMLPSLAALIVTLVTLITRLL